MIEDILHFLVEDIFEQNHNLLYLLLVVVPIILFPWFVKWQQRIIISLPICCYFIVAILSGIQWEYKLAITIFLPVAYAVLRSHVYASLFGVGSVFAERPN